MTRRFDEIYIPRGEHEQIVTYYKKLVAHVHRRLRALQDELAGAEASEKTCNPEVKAVLVNADLQPTKSNVIQVDFRRLRRLSS